ncbi:MAG: hypothetical protein NTW87_16185 [Planctomycetota bacterium]|nr:hypothetical protein [Planctomycetota bacterium]
MFSGRTLSFVKDHFDTVVLSLDGPQSDQDLHRPLRDGGSGFERVCATAHRSHSAARLPRH